MRILAVTTFVTAAMAVGALFPARARAEAGRIITGPFTFNNLSIYFIHGPSEPGPIPLTLQEAMAKGTVHVIETGSVNELKIENSGDEEVFVQSGDIVKGGRQDRVLTVSFVLPRKSGEIPVASYCVEHGRWSARGGEDSAKFAGSYNSIPSRRAKLAMKVPAQAMPSEPAAARASGNAYAVRDVGSRQQAIWQEVAKTQERLSAGINAAVASPVSASSLELSLENEKLKQIRAEYAKALEDKAGDDDVIGFVFAVNGRINSADVYPSNALFRKMWAKLLAASISEAVGERSEAKEQELPSLDAVRSFLASAEKGKPQTQSIGTLAREETRDAGEALYIQASRTSGEWVHRNYLAK